MLIGSVLKNPSESGEALFEWPIYEVLMFVAYNAFLFLVDFTNTVYFLVMGFNYSRILKDHFKFIRKRFLCCITFISAWFIVTLFRFEVFYGVVSYLDYPYN